MKAKLKTRISRVLSLLLAVNMILSLVFVADIFYPGSGDRAYAASESSVMGTDQYTTGVTGGATLTAGTTYTFGGYSWVCAETSGNLAVLQSTGVTSGYWPGYIMSGTITNAAGNTLTLTSANSYFTSNIDGYDISNYDQKTKDLYAAIKAAEYTNASYGKGLYLVSNAKCNQTSSGNQGSGNYWAAHKTAAGNYSSFGASNSGSWLGTVNGNGSAWYVNSSGDVYSNRQYHSYVLAPAFNLDTSKVRLSGTSLTVATFADSTGIEATQSISSVTEGNSVNLAGIITKVNYKGGDNNGKSASYTISVPDGCGTVSGTTWTPPTGLNTDKTVTLTIKDTRKGFSTTKNVSVKPRAASRITVKNTYSGPLKTGTNVNFKQFLTVSAVDSGGESDGTISSYTISGGAGTFNGTNYTQGKVDSTKTLTFTVTAAGKAGNVDYTGKTATFTVNTEYQNATGISATQSKTEVTEGSTVNLKDIITKVTYTGGDAEGSTSSGYSVIPSEGSANGDNWSVPTSINTDKAVTLTVKDTAKGYSTTKNVSVKPRTAKSIKVTKKANFPEYLVDGKSVDLSQYIDVGGFDAGDQSDGTISSYTLSGDSGTFNGKVYTPGHTTTAAEATITVTANGSAGSVSYAGKTATFTIKVKPATTGWTDRDEYFDTKQFHTYKDSATGITWKFRYNNDGYIKYLYTEDNIEQIISSGKVLLVPSSINGVQVVGIGGGSAADTSVIPFIPSSGNNVNNSWTSIYIPASVKTINDGAFYQNGASADIAVPGTVSEIGVNAFKESKIKTVVFNDATALTLKSQSFADIPALTSVSFRGNGITIGTRAFQNDTGLTAVDIPNGTKFSGDSDSDNSYAFGGTTGLNLIKIDTDVVYSNTFSGNRNLAKVIFGTNVTRVKQDWAGTSSSNSSTLSGTVNRTTYVLNADTIFEMGKSGNSPFGYAGSLSVIGKSHTLDNWSDKYSDSSDPVIGKVAYLAANYNSINNIKTYTKGAASSIAINVKDDPSKENGVTETVVSKQSGIEAYYSGLIMSGRDLNKEKMTVYKMFGSAQNGKYDSADFYVIRTSDADALLGNSNITKQQNAEGEWIATYTDDVINRYKAKDGVTVTDGDLNAGSTVTVKVIVLLKDADGKVLVDNANSDKVKAYSCAVTIPIKKYTAEDDFLETYGSYQNVIDTINNLKSENQTLATTITNLNDAIQSKEAEITRLGNQITTLTSEKEQLIHDKNDLGAQITELNRKIEEKDGNISELTEQKTALEAKKAELEATITEKDTKISDLNSQVTAKNDEIKELKAERDSLNTSLAETQKKLADMINQYAKLLDSTEIDESDFTYTVTDPDTGKSIDYVLVNGGEATYDKDSAKDVCLPDGTKVTVYTGTDKDGHEFLFYIASDGVHVVTIKTVDGKDTVATDELSTDTLIAMQRKIAKELVELKAKLAAANQEIQDINEALDNLYLALCTATGDMTKFRDGITDGNETAADKINSISSMVQTLSNNYARNNAYLRKNIAEINRAFGYGDYAKYNDKYVFVIYENDSFAYYIKTDGDNRQYLYFTGEGFEEPSESEMAGLAGAYDGTDGEKFLMLTDRVNGWDPYVPNPLTTYQKAMQAFINGFNSFDEKSEELLTAVNAINNKNPGDDGYLYIPDDATAEEKKNTAATALDSVKNKLYDLEQKRSGYADALAKISQVLDGYLNMGEGSASDMTEEELAALIQKAADTKAKLDGLQGDMDDVNAALANLWTTLDDAFSNMGLESGISTENKGRGEESTADKINSISGMVQIITDSYNTLKVQYGDLEKDYQKVIDYVYGEDEKTVDQVTADQIISQLEANKQSEIAAAVEAALADSDNFNSYSVALQKKIAGTIDKILDGEEADTTDLQPELAAALADVKTMQTELAAMKSGSSAYAEFLQTLRTALSLDDTADAATILESIQGLKIQVASLTSDLTEANTTIGKIQSKLATDKTGDDLVALVGKGDGDTDAAYKEGYNAGYAAGKKDAESSSNTGSGTSSADYQNGYNAGYVAGTKANTGTGTGSSDSAQAQILSLTKENASLTSDNKELTNTVETLQDGIDDLYESVTSTAASTASLKGASAAGYVSKLSKVKDLYNELSKNASAAATENSALSGSNEKLKAANKTLTTSTKNLKESNKTLKQKNEKLTTQNKALTEKNKTLTSKNSSLTSENNSLRAANSSLKTQASSRPATQTEAQPSTSSTNIGNNTIQNPAANQKSSSSSQPAENGTSNKTDKKAKDDEEDTETNKLDETENSSMPFSINSVSTPGGFGSTEQELTESSENDELTADLPSGQTPTEESDKDSGGSLKSVFLIISLLALLIGGFIVIVLRRKQRTR